MFVFRKAYHINKRNYLVLNSHTMKGGNVDENLSITRTIDKLATNDINNIKVIEFKDLQGLVMRVYEREGKNIDEILFTPPNVFKYLEKINNTNYTNYYKKQYGNILKNNLSNVELNFPKSDNNINTNSSQVNVAFYDNYKGKNSIVFTINLPIKLIDFIEKLFDHFDQVGLEGYPDNGGIDFIKYDNVNNVYLVQTWS